MPKVMSTAELMSRVASRFSSNDLIGVAYDDNSGVLTVNRIASYASEYEPAERRFIEVEKLLSVLETFTPGFPLSAEYWRTILTEKLDAHEL
jgi:uncharacterized protein (UPF0305 family)